MQEIDPSIFKGKSEVVGDRAMAEMPKYKSHKTIWALKIAAIEFDRDGSAKIAPSDKGYATVNTKPDFRSRFKGSDTDLGYYVVYSDGYQSWSPTKAFEEGYTRI